MIMAHLDYTLLLVSYEYVWWWNWKLCRRKPKRRSSTTPQPCGTLRWLFGLLLEEDSHLSLVFPRLSSFSASLCLSPPLCIHLVFWSPVFSRSNPATWGPRQFEPMLLVQTCVVCAMAFLPACCSCNSVLFVQKVSWFVGLEKARRQRRVKILLYETRLSSICCPAQCSLSSLSAVHLLRRPIFQHVKEEVGQGGCDRRHTE